VAPGLRFHASTVIPFPLWGECQEGNAGFDVLERAVPWPKSGHGDRPPANLSSRIFFQENKFLECRGGTPFA